MLPVQQILIKSTVKENMKYSERKYVKSCLFNGVNHVLIACPAAEIEALKDRLFIPECHILGL